MSRHQLIRAVDGGSIRLGIECIFDASPHNRLDRLDFVQRLGRVQEHQAMVTHPATKRAKLVLSTSIGQAFAPLLGHDCGGTGRAEDGVEGDISLCRRNVSTWLAGRPAVRDWQPRTPCMWATSRNKPRLTAFTSRRSTFARATVRDKEHACQAGKSTQSSLPLTELSIKRHYRQS